MPFFYFVIIVPIPVSVKISSKILCGIRPSIICTRCTPAPIALTQPSTFGIMPPLMIPSLIRRRVSWRAHFKNNIPFCVLHAVDIGQKHQLFCLERARDYACDCVGVDVVALPAFIRADWCDNGDIFVAREQIEQLAVDLYHVAHIADVGFFAVHLGVILFRTPTARRQCR